MPALKFVLGCAIAASFATPAAATMPTSRTIMADYVRARAADADGQAAAAAKAYGAVLAASPANATIARRAYRQALIAGDRPLALKAVKALEAQNALPPDARLFLIAEAVDAGEWKQAALLADQIEKDGAFAFVVPVLRAWIAYGAHSGDPLAPLEGARKAGGLATAYAADHRALLLLLIKDRQNEGIAAVQASGMTDTVRSTRLRLAAAAEIAKTDKTRALALLGGDDAVFALARQRIEAGKALPGAVDSSAKGISELFVRIAIDVNRERVAPLAIGFARLATFLAPDNAEAWAVTAGLLGANGQESAALAALDRISAADPLADAASALRVRLLVQQDDLEAGLKAALARANSPAADANDWATVGGVYMQMKRPADAATAYTRALALTRPAEGDKARWPLLLLQANALDEAGNWPAAKAALKTAVKIAPDQPAVLNYLGYAQLERRENLVEATALVEQASKLKPDDAAITDSLGWAYYLQGNIAEAITTLERAVAGDPGQTTLNEHLGDAYWSAGRRIEARWAWGAALVFASGDDASRLQGKIDNGLTARTAKR